MLQHPSGVRVGQRVDSPVSAGSARSSMHSDSSGAASTSAGGMQQRHNSAQHGKWSDVGLGNVIVAAPLPPHRALDSISDNSEVDVMSSFNESGYASQCNIAELLASGASVS
jgi:hypothetical protein